MPQSHEAVVQALGVRRLPQTQLLQADATTDEEPAMESLSERVDQTNVLLLQRQDQPILSPSRPHA